MDEKSRPIIAIFATCGAIWDLVTTYLGMYDYTGQNVVVAAIFTFLINGIIFLTFMKVTDNLIKLIGAICLFFALIGDFYTAYLGNESLIMNEGGFITFCLTLITVSSSLIISYLIFRPKGMSSDFINNFFNQFK